MSVNPEIDMPFSKEARRKYQPGYKKAKAKVERTKGQDQEHEVAKKLGGKVNNQRREGGGLSVPDVSFGQFNVESKSSPKEQIRAALTEIEKETPLDKRPALVFVHNGRKWITFPLDNHVEFAADVVERNGGEVLWP